METGFALRIIAAFAFHLCGILVFSSSNGEEIPCEYRGMTNFLQQLAANYSHVARLESIGLTDEDRELWVIIVSDNPHHRPLLRPQVKFVGNINGMSGPACFLLLRLAKHLVEQYENEASMERKLMESMEIHIIPNFNPDGYAKAVPGSCFGNEGRCNSQNVKLNTNFPDIFAHQENLILQKETEAMMRYIEENKFIISVSIISGAKVVVYPFDSISLMEEVGGGGPLDGQPHLTPDSDIFQHLALTYVEKTGGSEIEWYCPMLERSFQDGIINGAEWKPQSGTMMDYNYIHGTFELMVGISCCRNENNATILNELWWRNREGLLHVIHEVQGGIRGQVLDSETYDAIEAAKLSRGGDDDLQENDGLPHIPWFTSEFGEFWRPWLPGTYKLQVEKDGYKTKVVQVTVHHYQATFIRVELEKNVTATPPTIHHPPSTERAVEDNWGIKETTTSPSQGPTDHSLLHHDTSQATILFSEPDNDDESRVEEPEISSSKHYLSLTQLDHSFITLFRGVHSKSSSDRVKASSRVGVMTCSVVLLLLLRFPLSAL